MKIENYQFPQSSFLSVEKDYNIIIKALLSNKKLQKLLYYADKNCEKAPDLTQEQVLSLINSQIKIVPKLEVDKDVFAYIIITMDGFIPNDENPEFRDNIISFDIICHYDQWNLGDFKLRPYKIASEIDSMFNKKHLTGIGTLEFFSGTQIILNDELGGLSINYRAIHGKDDKVN